MASAMRKMAVYLGLVEDDHRYQDKYDSYGEYEDYEESGAPRSQKSLTRAPERERGGVEGGGYQLPDWRPSSPSRSRSYHDTASSHLQ